MAFISRRFAGSSDISLLVDWLRAIRPHERLADYPSVTDLPQLLLLPYNQETTRLWFADTGDLLGFALVDAFCTLRFELDWQRTSSALEVAIVDWGKDCLMKTSATVTPSSLYATAHETDAVRIACLERQSFTRLAGTIVHLERSLAKPIKIPQLPGGFTIRTVEGEHEATELATLHRSAFGTLHMTTERRLAIMRTAHYDPALDLVVVTAEGVPVAYGIGSVNPEENVLTGQHASYTDLFATHPRYRGRGLARALLVSLLRLLQARGFTVAKLNTSSENAPMQQVATSEAFQIVSTTLRFTRPIDSNESGGSTSS